MTVPPEPRPLLRSGLPPAPTRLDLASPSRAAGPPPWLRGRLERALDLLGSAPDEAAAVRAVARRHDREEAAVALAGGDALRTLAHVLRADRPCVVGPTELARVAPFGAQVVAADAVPDDADLVVVANPSDATGVLHEGVERLCRPGRVVVADETYADDVPGEPHSVAGRTDLPGLVVVRSLTSTWSLPGLPVEYLLAPPELAPRLRGRASAPELVVLETCLARGPVRTAEKEAQQVAEERGRLVAALAGLGVETASSQSSLLLCGLLGRTDLPGRLREQEVDVLPGEALGLDAEHWRTTVRGPAQSERLLAALVAVL